MSSFGRRALLSTSAVLAAGAAVLSSCGSPMSSGTWGEFRYIANLPGQVPLPLVPPISDRSGNVYTLYGAIGLPQVEVFVSTFGGSSYASCTVTKGDAYGAHGWVGFSGIGAWYWSGFALVYVPFTGGCTQVLNTDPSTNTDLQFRGVLPWVYSGLQHTTVVALVQSDVDTVPFATLVDLDESIATNVAQFQPSDATSVLVAGVGADPASDLGFALVTYTESGSTKTEALFYDNAANLVATAPITGVPLDEYSIVGYLQPVGGGTVAGLTKAGALAIFNEQGGAIVAVDPTIQPAGVHLVDGHGWLVGSQNGKPVILSIDASGNLGAPTEWLSSEQAASNLAGPLTVRDERSLPTRPTVWPSATTAVGPFPFVSPFSPWPQAPATTLWAIAGPVTSPGTGEVLTSVAVAPVGITYP